MSDDPRHGSIDPDQDDETPPDSDDLPEDVRNGDVEE